MAEKIPERRILLDPPRPSTQRYLKGPVPWPWLQRAMCASGNALSVGIVLWYLAGMEGSLTFGVTIPRIARETGLAERTCQRAVRALDDEDLIQVDRPPGRKMQVTIIE